MVMNRFVLSHLSLYFVRSEIHFRKLKKKSTVKFRIWIFYSVYIKLRMRVSQWAAYVTFVFIWTDMDKKRCTEKFII